MKTGRFSKREISYIKINLAAGPELIAEELDRDPRSVKQWIERNGIARQSSDGTLVAVSLNNIAQNINTNITPLKVLRAESFFPSIQQQLEPDEITYFEQTWIDILEQFDGDIRTTEKIQLKQFILIDIFMTRINVGKKNTHNRLADLSLELRKEYAAEMDERDRAKITELQAEKNYLQLSLKENDKLHNEYLKESKYIQKQLDGARSERRKAIESSKSNFAGFIRSLEQQKVRVEVGREMEIIKLSTQTAKNKLYELAEFADGKFDPPILCADSVDFIVETDSENDPPPEPSDKVRQTSERLGRK